MTEARWVAAETMTAGPSPLSCHRTGLCGIARSTSSALTDSHALETANLIRQERRCWGSHSLWHDDARRPSWLCGRLMPGSRRQRTRSTS